MKRKYEGEELIATGAWRQCRVCKQMHAMDSHIYVCDECADTGDGTTEGEVISLLDQIGKGMKP